MRKVINFLVRLKRSIKRRITKFIVSKLVSKVGDNFICDESVTIYGGDEIMIGDNVVINKGVFLQSCEGARITIGNDVTFSYGVKLITGNLILSCSDLNKRTHSSKPIKIENSVWVGSNTIILPGVNITNNVIIAAGSIVTKSLLESNYIYGGVPAKKIKKICE